MDQYDPDLEYDESRSPTVLDDLDPDKIQRYVDLCRTRQSLPRAFLAGSFGAAAATAAWVAVTIGTGQRVAWMAIAVGVAVGLAVRWAGRGIDTAFGVLGAWLVLFGCLAGNLVSGLWFVARHTEGATFMSTLTDLTPEVIAAIYRDVLGWGTILLYLAGLATAFKLSVRRIGRAELVRNVLDDRPAAPDSMAA